MEKPELDGTEAIEFCARIADLSMTPVVVLTVFCYLTAGSLHSEWLVIVGNLGFAWLFFSGFAMLNSVFFGKKGILRRANRP